MTLNRSLEKFKKLSSEGKKKNLKLSIWLGVLSSVFFTALGFIQIFIYPGLWLLAIGSVSSLVLTIFILLREFNLKLDILVSEKQVNN